MWSQGVCCFCFVKIGSISKCSVCSWERSRVERNFDNLGRRGEPCENKILKSMRRNGAQCTYGSFGFRMECRQFTRMESKLCGNRCRLEVEEVVGANGNSFLIVFVFLAEIELKPIS